MRLNEIKFIYVTKTYNSYKRLISEYVAIDFNNKVIVKMDEKGFEKFMNRNLGNLVRAKSVVNDFFVDVYLVKSNTVEIKKENDVLIAYLQKQDATDLFDFETLILEDIAEQDLKEINKTI